MTTIKSYTDLEQSRKLAEILPLESADMCYLSEESLFPKINYNGMVFFNSEEEKPSTIIPCWSLAALLDIIPDSIYDNTNEFSQLEFSKKSVAYHDLNDGIKIGSLKDNLIDACYEIIIELNEKGLL